MRGTHRGPFFGVPPTGKPILGQSMAIYRLAGGQIVEENGLPDMLGILQQIGALPTP
jgi:predicted ester cyclase